jgi:hypothetical protein
VAAVELIDTAVRRTVFVYIILKRNIVQQNIVAAAGCDNPVVIAFGFSLQDAEEKVVFQLFSALNIA